MGPLAGIRVLDLTRLLPGPYATMLLADLGADVLKVESPAKPDYLRFFPPPADEAFALLNRNKRSVMLAWDTPAGSDLLRRLASRCDVLVESFRSGYLARFGLDAGHLDERLVYCSMSGYGQQDPRAGHDLNFLARSGLAAQFLSQGRPVVPGVQLADLSGGMSAAMAIMAALVERGRTGRGRHLDVALVDAPAAFTLLQSAGLEIDTLSGRVPGYRYYRCQDDRWLSVGALEEGFRDRICQALGISSEGWLDLDHPLATKLEELFATAPREHWLALLEPLDACVEPVLQPSEWRGRVPRRSLGQSDSPPGLLDASFPPTQAGFPASDPGQHTREVLLELGVTATELAELVGAETVALAQ